MCEVGRTTLYCCSCGFPNLQVLIIACRQCGGTSFSSTPQPQSFEHALTPKDKLLLKALKIKTE